MGKGRARVSLKKHLSMRIDYVERIADLYEGASRERDHLADRTDLARIATLAASVAATGEAQAKAVALALDTATALAKELAAATGKSTDTIVTRLDGIDRTLAAGSNRKEGVDSWWTRARINVAAVIGFLTFISGAALILLSLARGGTG